MNRPTLESMTSAEFGRLFARYRRPFINVAYGYLRDAMAAEDIVSDSFLAFWENRHRLPGDTNIPAYVMTTVRNNCLNRLKQQALHAKIEQGIYQSQLKLIQTNIRSLELCNPERLFADEVYEIITKKLAEMPESTSRVFIDARYMSKTYREIAEEMGITVRRVEYELRKAVSILQSALKDYAPAIVTAIIINQL